MNEGILKRNLWSRSWLVLLLALGGQGCAEQLSTPRLPADRQLAFPSALQWLPQHQTVLILNTNFDQQYQTGMLSALSLPQLARVWPEYRGKELHASSDLLYPLVAVPSLGGQLIWHESLGVGLIPHRGSGLLTYLEQDQTVTAGRLAIHCGDRNSTARLDKMAQSSDCDADHLLNLPQQIDPTRSALLEDGFAATIFPHALEPSVGQAWVGQLRNGWLSQVKLWPGKIELLGQQELMTSGVLDLQSFTGSQGKTTILAVGDGQSTGRSTALWQWLWSHEAEPNPLRVEKTAIVPQEITVGTLHAVCVAQQGQSLYTLSSEPNHLISWQRQERAQGTNGQLPTLENTFAIASMLPMADVGRASQMALWPQDSQQEWLAVTSYLQQTLWLLRCQKGACSVWSRVDVDVGDGPYQAVFIANPLLPSPQAEQSPWLVVSLFDSNKLLIVDVVGHPQQGRLATMVVQNK